MKRHFLLYLSFILLPWQLFAQDIKLDQKKVDAIETLVEKKLLKFDTELDKAWVAPVVWDQYNVDGKKSFTLLCALYIRYKERDKKNPASIDLYNYNSGKKIASYGSIMGFRIVN